jgi:hypothetical protein
VKSLILFWEGFFQFLADTQIAPNDKNEAEDKGDVIGSGHAVGYGENAGHTDHNGHCFFTDFVCHD